MVSGTICFDRLLDRNPGVPRLRQVTQEGSVPRAVPRTATRLNTENSDIGSPGTSDVRNRPLWVVCRPWREIYPNFLSWQKSVLLDLRDFSERNVNSSRPCGAWVMKRPTLTPCCSNTTAYTRDSSLPGIGFERSRSKAMWHRPLLRWLRDNVHSADQNRTASGRLAALNQYG